MSTESTRKASENPERLAYWYFRLNGFFTTENFVVHPDIGKKQKTDADLLAVRFSHRAENLERTMEDDDKVVGCTKLVNVIIVEVKKSHCNLNGPWTDPKARNMQRVLKSIGCVGPDFLEHACKRLYAKGEWANDFVQVRLFAIGETKRGDLIINDQQQLAWDDVIGFIVTRFREYRNQKSSVGQWSEDGRKLKALALGKDPEKAIREWYDLEPKTVVGE